LALNAKLRNIRLTVGEISPSGFLFFHGQEGPLNTLAASAPHYGFRIRVSHSESIRSSENAGGYSMMRNNLRVFVSERRSSKRERLTSPRPQLLPAGI